MKNTTKNSYIRIKRYVLFLIQYFLLEKPRKKNLAILKIADRAECIHADAAEFTGYGTYNVFFFFNPFSEKILRRVASRIIESRDEMEEIIVIYHNPRFLSVFEENFRITEKEMMYDNLKNYDTCIFKCVRRHL